MTNSYKNYSKNGILNFISFYNVSTNKIYSNLQFIHKKIKITHLRSSVSCNNRLSTSL